MNAEKANGENGARNLRMGEALEAGRRADVDHVGPLRDALRGVLPEGWALVPCDAGWRLSRRLDATEPAGNLWSAVSRGLEELIDAACRAGFGVVGSWPGFDRARALVDAMGGFSAECGDHGLDMEEICPSDDDQAARVMELLLDVVFAGEAPEVVAPAQKDLEEAPADEGLSGFCHLVNLADAETAGMPARTVRAICAARVARSILRPAAPVFADLDPKARRGVREFLDFAERRPKEAARLIGTANGGGR